MKKKIKKPHVKGKKIMYKRVGQPVVTKKGLN